MTRLYTPSRGVCDWRARLADPSLHWKREASAMELATSWELASRTARGLPASVARVLDEHPSTRGANLLFGMPEHKVPLRGGRRASQTDLWAVLKVDDGWASMAVEGKAREPFGPTINEWLREESEGKRTRLQPQDCLTELPDANWNPLQRWLLDVLPGERLEPTAFQIPGVSTPRRLNATKTQRVKPEAATNPFAFLMAPALAATRGPQTPTIDLFHAGGREAEIEEVFRRILAAGASLDQVEIACATDDHLALIWEKALRHDWPVTLGAGIPATFTRPGRAVLGFCDWIETDFAAGHLRRLLQSGDLSVENREGEDLTAGQAARVLARAEAGWGRATYALAIARVVKSHESRAVDPDVSDADRDYAREKGEQAVRVGKWIANLIADVPTPTTDSKVPLQDVVSGVLDFLEHRTARSSALDHRAAAALHEYIGELRALGAFSCALPEALRFVRERVQSLTVAPERPRPGHLYASHLSQAGYAGRPHLFVVGLEEGRVFSSSTEDAVLLDVERSAISADLRLSTDRIDEAVYAVLSRLAVSGASATFSYSSRDTREFRETYASWMMLQAYRLQQGNQALSYQAMKTTLGEPKSVVPSDRDRALSSNGWWLRSVVGSGAQGTAALAASFVPVARGRAAEERRESADFTEFDGHVSGAGPVLDPSIKVYSVTELEKAAVCPFRFFLKNGLGVRPVDERERDKDVWLDPLTRGSELHEMYASLLRRTRDENRRPTDADGAWLLALARARLTELNEEMPAPTPEILERETADFLADVELFLEEEIRDTTSTPIGFEVSFGRALGDDEDPLARAEPVEVALGAGITLRIAGRMDRINKVGPAAFEVVDYKTGGFWRDDYKGVFAGGTRLQHALYGLAAVELLKSRYKKPTVSGGVYYFSSRKGGQERVRIPAPTQASIAAVLSDLRDVIITGQFTRTPDEGDCRFCDYASVCGGNVNAQAEAKAGDARFNAFGRLAAHE